MFPLKKEAEVKDTHSEGLEAHFAADSQCLTLQGTSQNPPPKHVR